MVVIRHIDHTRKSREFVTTGTVAWLRLVRLGKAALETHQRGRRQKARPKLRLAPATHVPTDLISATQVGAPSAAAGFLTHYKLS